MVRAVLVLLVLAAGAWAHDCRFCQAELVVAKSNPEPWLARLVCPDCGAVVKIYGDGTSSHAVYRDGKKQILIVDPHAATRPSHPVAPPAHAIARPAQATQRPDQAVARPDHAVRRPEHPVSRPDHALVRRGHAVGRPGHAVGRPGHAILRLTRRPAPMYAEVRVRAQPRTYAKPYRR
jgi:hypothetical protein